MPLTWIILFLAINFYRCHDDYHIFSFCSQPELGFLCMAEKPQFSSCSVSASTEFILQAGGCCLTGFNLRKEKDVLEL